MDTPSYLIDRDDIAKLAKVSKRQTYRLPLPAPILLGPRTERWIRTEVEQALTAMPRQANAEPAQLERARAIKAAGKAPGPFDRLTS